MKNNLLDASAFMLLIKKADATATMGCIRNSTILDLTIYEVGNAVWKETTLTKFLTPQESKTLENAAKTILAKTDCLANDPNIFGQILDVAKNEKLTFYDSSYIVAAKEKNLVLVTEDKQLKAKAQKYVEVQTVAALTSSLP